MKSTAALPRARKDGLVIKELPNETLVYDLERDEAHCLNETAALVWKRCDGRTTIAKMTSLLQEQLDTSVNADVVWLAVKQLQRFHLIESYDAVPWSRRPCRDGIWCSSTRRRRWCCRSSCQSARRLRRRRPLPVHPIPASRTQVDWVVPVRLTINATRRIATREPAARSSNQSLRDKLSERAKELSLLTGTEMNPAGY